MTMQSWFTSSANTAAIESAVPPCNARTLCECREVAKSMRAADGALLLTLWASRRSRSRWPLSCYAAFLRCRGLLVVEHACTLLPSRPHPGLANFFPSAVRMQRAVFDLLGIAAIESDQRGMAAPRRMAGTMYSPFGETSMAATQFSAGFRPIPSCGSRATACMRSPWVRSTPASSSRATFASRWSARRSCGSRSGSGTRTKESKSASRACRKEGHRLAARVSRRFARSRIRGPTAQALEGIAGDDCPPPRAADCAPCALELERLANHLGDLARLATTLALPWTHPVLAPEGRLLRANQHAFGARYLMDFIVPGGVASDLPRTTPRSLLESL